MRNEVSFQVFVLCPLIICQHLSGTRNDSLEKRFCFLIWDLANDSLQDLKISIWSVSFKNMTRRTTRSFGRDTDRVDVAQRDYLYC